MASGQKIASAAVKNRSQAPFWVWLRNKLLAVDRQKITPPAGLGTPDGKVPFKLPDVSSFCFLFFKLCAQDTIPIEIKAILQK